MRSDLENSARNPDISEVDADDVALHVIGPDSERPKSRKLKYFLIFLLFQLVYTYILFVVFFSPKAIDGLTPTQTAVTTEPLKPTTPKTENPSTGTGEVTQPAENPTKSTEPETPTNPTNPTNPTTPTTPTTPTEPTTPTNPTTETPGTKTDPTTNPTTTPEEPFKGTVLNFDKVATIIETRADSRLVPIILHFASVVGDDWPFKIFYSKANKHLFDNSVAIQKHIKSGRFELIALQDGLNFFGRPSVTQFLTKRWVWEQLAPAKKVLLFQMDSIICANADKTVDDYLQYDWLGAPWNQNGGGNGGLSIRNRDKILKIIDTYPNNPYQEAEDVYYWKHMQELPEPSMPSFETSNKFSVELVWNDKPLGYHQPYRYWQNRINEIETYCPEAKLTIQSYV